MTDIPIKDLELSDSIQPRDGTNQETVDSYAEAMLDGDVFPPIVVFHSEGRYWIGDGFHRVYGAKAAGLRHIAAEVREGGKRDALIHALGANPRHGLTRTNADKRRGVTLSLKDAEWVKWSDRQIAKMCAVSPTFVGLMRVGLASVLVASATVEACQEVVATRNGKPYKMKTANIGHGEDAAENGQGNVDAKRTNQKNCVVLEKVLHRLDQAASRCGLAKGIDLSLQLECLRACRDSFEEALRGIPQ